MQRIILNPNSNNFTQSVATIGNFDGVHLGHQKLLIHLQKIKEECNYRSVVIIFEPQPLEYFLQKNGAESPSRLSFLRDKVRFFQRLGYIDEVIVLHFNEHIANIEPSTFINSILKDKLKVCHLVIGHDFKFGKDALGTKNDLVASGIKVSEIEPYLKDGVLVSSSLIRNLGKKNELSQIKKLLGRNLQYTRRVVHGGKIGSKNDVPTINLSLGQNIPALHGIYVVLVHIDEKCYPAVASIGKHPTTNTGDKYNLEAHLLDVSLYLYGKIATIEILSFLREEIKFNNLEDLFKQIKLDIAKTREYFLKN